MRAVNLLPQAHRSGPRPGAPAGGSYVVLGVLGVLLVMALAITVVSNQANSRKSQTAVVKAEADRSEAQAARLGAFGDFASIKATRTASVQQLATGRFDWERFLRELGSVLPEGSWLQDVSASVTGDVASAGGTSSGSSTSSTSSAATLASPNAPKLPAAQLTGCTPHQHDVADLMVRLRKLYLVSDVELKSSERGQGTGVPTIEDCGRYLKFDLSVTFKAAAPTGREAPAGDKTVPARLGGGS
jgi:Tfp pilus assembly protein PilN